MSTWAAAAILLLAALAFGGAQTVRLAHANLAISEQKAAYAQRDAEASAVVAAAVQKRQNEVRALEAKSAEDVADTSATFEREKANAAKRNQKVIADLHTGMLSLRVQLASVTAQGDRGSSAEVGAGSVRCDGGPATGILGQADAAFLVAEASHADEVVLQLRAAQTLIRKDREVCK